MWARRALNSPFWLFLARAVDETALIGACMHGHLDVAELLLRLGARTNTTDGHGCTPMMRAAVTIWLARIFIDTHVPNQFGVPSV